MAFSDYSATPASNTTIGDNIFIGPNMERGKVRPALQQLAADGKQLSDTVTTLATSGVNTDGLLRTDLAASTGSSLVGFQQSGTGAVARTMQAKGRDVLNLADFLPAGYDATGGTNYRANVIAAINEAIASRRALIHPGGIINITGRIDVALSGTQELTIIGTGGLNSVFRSTSGGAFRLSGQFFRFNDLGVDVLSGGHVFEQTALVAQSRFLNCYFAQNDPAYSIWENANQEFVNNRVLYCSLDHVTNSTAHAWNLVAPGGLINANLFIGNRCDKTGTKHFFNVESTTNNAHQFGNGWQYNTFEICRGGGIRLRAVRDFSIDFNENWDAGAGLLVNDFYDLDRNVHGLGCQGQIYRCSRKDGTYAAGKYDVKLPSGGGGAGIEVKHCTYSGGAFTVDAANNGIVTEGVGSDMTVTNNAGQNGIDTSLGLIIAGGKVVGPRGAALPADATDLATVIALANAIKARMKATGGHGLVAD